MPNDLNDLAANEHPDQLALRLVYEALWKHVDKQTGIDIVNAIQNEHVLFRMPDWWIEQQSSARPEPVAAGPVADSDREIKILRGTIASFITTLNSALDRAETAEALYAALETIRSVPALPGEAEITDERLFYAMRDHLTLDMCRSILAEDDMRWSGPSFEAQEAITKIAAALAGETK